MRGYAWVTTDERELRRCYGYESTRMIAARMGRTPESIRVKAKRLGLSKDKDPDPLSFYTHSIKPNRMKTLIKSYAAQFDLPEWLVSAIVHVESSGNPWAMRYEPTFYRLYIADMDGVRPISPCSLMTEKMGRATSWGLMQIMGQVARERGFTGAFLSSLCQPEMGLEWGCRQLVHLTARYKVSESWEPVIRAYNGGNPRADNLDYVKKVMAAREYHRE